MSKGLPDPLHLFKEGGIGLPDPLGIMEGSRENNAKKPKDIKPGELPVAPTNADINARVPDFVTLDQQIGQRAVAAGAVRGDNQADVLGYAPPAKRRAASRVLLG